MALKSVPDAGGNNMKAFAKAFYSSSAWQACRAAYISQRRQIDGGLCEECGEVPGEELHHTIFLTPQNVGDADVALNPEKLKWLCKDCHFKAHREAIIRGFEKRRNRKILTNGVWFGPDGKPVPQRVAIVWGPPGCGKSTYIRRHMDPTDLVVDLDLIRQALTMGGRESTANNLVALSIAARECLFRLIEARDERVDCKTVWISATLPRRREREELARRLRADLVFVGKPFEICLEQIMADQDRSDKLLQREILERWFEQYEP